MHRARLSTTTLAAALLTGTTIWLSLGSLAVADADRARRIGLLPPLWLLALLLVTAVALIVAIRPASRTCLPLFLSALVALPWVPLNVPTVFLAWTGHAIFFVWGAIVFGIVIAAMPRPSERRFSWLRSPVAAPRAAALLAFAVFVGVWLGQVLPPNGDEPHYLVIAQSMLRDHDVKVANNYQRGDYLSYYGGPLRPHLSPPGGGGEQYSVHAPGLPALIAPAFALGGYPAVVLWIAVCSAFGTALVWKAGYLLTGDAGAAWFGWAAVALTMPVVVHGTLVYPDPMAGVVLAGGALALVAVSANERRGPTVREATGPLPPWPRSGSLVLGVAIAVLPWLHTRLALPAGTLFVLLMLHVAGGRCFSGDRWRHLFLFTAPAAFSAIGWLLFFWVTYGTFNPAAPYGDRVPLQIGRIAGGMLAMAVDQEFGLLPNAPVHLLWSVGLWSVFRRRPRLGVELLLLVLPYAIASSAFPMWWGGSSAPARFLVPIVFPLGVTVASAWAHQGGRGRAASLTLLAASAMIAAAVAVGGDGRLAYNAATARARWLDWIAPLVDLPRGLPSFFRATAIVDPAHSNVVTELLKPACVWGAALAAGGVVFLVLDKWLRTPPARALTAPVCLVAACALATTATWRAAPDSPVTSTRAQLQLLRDQNPRLRPLGVQLVPMRAVQAADVPARLVITTSSFSTPPPGAMLFLEELPAGDYRLRVTRQPSARGELTLGIGRFSLPAARWLVAAESDVAFHLPVRASILTVRGDADAQRSVEKIALVPDPQAAVDVPRDKERSAPPRTARARDAARYGSSVVYTLDDRVWLEPQGFWVMGARAPQVVIALDRQVDSVEVSMRNGPEANRVRTWSGGWSSERTVGPGESWQIRLPVPARARSILVGFDVQSGFIPADREPNSRDRRSLGCWVEVH